MKDAAKPELYLMGVVDAVTEFFNVEGPRLLGGDDGVEEEVMWLDFIHQSTETYVVTSSGLSKTTRAAASPHVLAKLYYQRGREGGRHVMDRLCRSVQEAEDFKARRWVNVGLRVEKLFQNFLDFNRKMCILLVERARFYDRRFTR